MSVITRKDGQNYVKWRENGKEKRKYFGRGPVARLEAEKYNASRVKRTPVKASGPTFEDIALAYIMAKAAGMPAESLKRLQIRLDTRIFPEFGSLQAQNLNPSRLDKYVLKRARKVKLTTIHRELSEVRAILNFAVQRKLIASSPMDGYELPERDDETILPVTAEEMEKVLHHSAPHLRRAIVLSFTLGLRPGAVELLSMQYNQVNWSVPSVTVISAKKGGIKRREIPVHPDLPLRQWYEEDGKDPERHIITYNGKPIKKMKTAWKRAKERAGVGGRKIPPYALRHAFVTQLLHAGVDIKTISEMAGHDAQTMIKTYAHTLDEVKKKAVQKLVYPLGTVNPENQE